ncbi:MAG: heme ABC transporter permease CcmC [Pseudomonadota bacterium]
MHALANPTRFLRIADWCKPLLLALFTASLGAGLYLAFFASPPDYQQGETVRIMYIHVPSAMMTTGLYAFMAIASAAALIWRHPLASLAAKSAAPAGAAFCFITLATGSLWGRPMWGTWWEWDGRMTSVLVQFFLYLGYMALWQAFSDRQRAANAAAILALVGVVNLVIIRFSVEWWNTLHQPASIIRAGGPTIDGSMLWPLAAMVVAASSYAGLIILSTMRIELKAMRLDALMSQRSAPAASYRLETT